MALLSPVEGATTQGFYLLLYSIAHITILLSLHHAMKVAKLVCMDTKKIFPTVTTKSICCCTLKLFR